MSKPSLLFSCLLSALLVACMPPATRPAPTPSASATASLSPGSETPISRVSTLADQRQGIGQPRGLALDRTGTFYLSSDHQILRVDVGGVRSFAGGSAGFADGKGSAARFSSPAALDFDSRGNLYVADAANHRIRKISPSGEVSTLSGGAAGYADGPLALARFFNPKGLAVDDDDNLYVSEGSTNAYHIRKITPAGDVSTLAGGAEGQADGQGRSAAFLQPQGLAVDGQGVVFVVDAGNHRIRRIAPDGTVTTLAGSRQGHADGSGEAALFNWPADLALDPQTGYLYVSEFNGNCIRQITPGGVVTTLLSAAGRQDGPLSQARISGPDGLQISPAGALYFLDSFNRALRKLSFATGS